MKKKLFENSEIDDESDDSIFAFGNLSEKQQLKGTALSKL